MPDPNSDNPQPPEIQVPPTFPGEYRLALRSLFLHPTLAFAIVTTRSWWGRGLLLALLLSLLSGTAKMLCIFPEMAMTWHRAALFISENVGNISLQQGKIIWEKQLDATLTGKLLNIRVDILPPGSQPPDTAELASGLDAQGILVSQEQLLYWCKTPGTEHNLSLAPVLQPPRLQKMQEMVDNGYLPACLTPPQLLQQVRLTSLLAAPAMAAILGLLRFKTIIVCVLLFSLFQCLFKRGGWRLLGAIAALGFHCCLPPLLLASVYDCLQLGWGEFEDIFWIMLLAYMLLIYLERRAVLRTEENC